MNNKASNDSFGLANVRFPIPDWSGLKYEVTNVQPITDPIAKAALIKAREPKYTLWTRLSKPLKQG